MLHGGNHPSALHAQGVCGGLLPHVARVFAETTHPNDRIVGVGVDIGIRGEVSLDAHPETLVSHLLAHLINQFIVGDGTQGHLVRIGHHLIDAHGNAPFTIDTDHQRRLSHGLPCVGLLHLSHCVGFEKAYATDIVSFNVLAHLLIKRLAGVVGTHADKLTNTLFKGKAVVNRVDPAGFGILG